MRFRTSSRRGTSRATALLFFATLAGTFCLSGLALETCAQANSVERTDQTKETKSEELLRLQDQLRRRAEEALANRREQRTRLDALTGEASAARRRNEAIEREIGKRERKLEEIEGLDTAAREKSATILAREEALKSRMQTFLTSLGAKIEAGIPWKINDRRHSVRDASELLSDRRTSAAAALATLGRLQKEQEAIGRLVESSVLEVEVGAESRAVSGFHLGLIGVIFASEDGSVLGFAGPGETLEAGLATVEAHPEAARGYLHTVDILNRRRTPGLTDIFIPKLPLEKGGRL